jgi:hypothetical protein
LLPIKRKICITPAMLESVPKDRGGCARTLVSSSAQLMEFHMQCGGSHQGSGTIRVAAVDRQTITISVDMTLGDKAESKSVQHSTLGHWLAADCGGVKPMD